MVLSSSALFCVAVVSVITTCCIADADLHTTTLVVWEGEEVTFFCSTSNVGDLPLIGLDVGLDLPLLIRQNRNRICSSLGCNFTMTNVTVEDGGTYICVKNRIDQRYVLVVKEMSCVSQPNITVFGVCTPYLEGRGNLYLGRTTPTINVISSIFEGIDSSSDCVQDLRKLVCFLAFPICQQSLGKPLPLPLCKEACDLAGEGRCQLEGYAFRQLRDLLTVNCGGPMPIAGDQPECIMIAGPACTIPTNTTITTSRRVCQSWGVHFPHIHGSVTPSLYPGELDDSSYCRNPGGRGSHPWCYTTDPDVRWEYCDLPMTSAASTIVAPTANESITNTTVHSTEDNGSSPISVLTITVLISASALFVTVIIAIATVVVVVMCVTKRRSSGGVVDIPLQAVGNATWSWL